MNAVDSSIHGWFLGPVPIALGIWSFVEVARILSKHKKVTRNNIMSVYGLSPIVATLACFAMGVVVRDDLSVRVLAIGSAFSGVLAFVSHGLIWRSTGAPLPTWFAEEKVRTYVLLKRVFLSLFLLFCYFIPFLVFGLGSAVCTTSSCRSAAILFGSNLAAGEAMWLVFAACGFILSLFLASAFALARRIVIGK